MGSKPNVKKKKKKKNKQNYIKKFRCQAQEWEQKAKKGSGPQPGWMALQNSREKGLFCLLVTGDIKVKVQAQVGISNPLLESKPSRSPLSAGLIPQTRYRSVPLNNKSFLPLKVPFQPMALLSQVFNRAHSLGSFAMDSI